MIYREPKEVIIDDFRVILVPIPGAAGYWMLCHPAVMVPCPVCGSKSGVPCTTDTGRVVLTQGQTNVAQQLIDGDHISPSRLQILRDRFRDVEYYRVQHHDERKILWRERGLNNPRGRKGPAVAESIRSLRASLVNAQQRLDEVEGKLKG